MNMHIIVNEFFGKSNWYKEFFEELKKIALKKHVHINVSENLDKPGIQPGGVVVLVGGSASWINTFSSKAAETAIRCIVIGSEGTLKQNCSFVGIDYETASRTVLEYMKKTGCRKIAYCGYNSDAGTDRKKLAGYKKLFGTAGVFENSGNAEECCFNFIKSIDRFDGVLCANDQIATLVAMETKKIAGFDKEKFKIASFGNTQVLKRVYPGALQVSLDMKSAAHHAMAVYTHLCENENVLKMSVSIKSRIFSGETEVDFAFLPKTNENADSEVNFYGDEAVAPIIRFENLLSQMDALDEKILNAVCNGMTYEQIEEQFNVSVTSVKYRIKKLIARCGVETRAELIAEAKKFI